MPIDEARLRKAVRGAAHGTHLERRRGDEIAAAHQHLNETLKKADEAVEQALQAVARMADAAR